MIGNEDEGGGVAMEMAFSGGFVHLLIRSLLLLCVCVLGDQAFPRMGVITVHDRVINASFPGQNPGLPSDGTVLALLPEAKARPQVPV